MPDLTVIVPPANEPVELDMLKNHLRVSVDDDDDLLKVYLQAAREGVESCTGRSLVEKTYKQTHDRFPHRHMEHGAGLYYSVPRYARHWNDDRSAIKLLRCPLVKIIKITYVDVNGVTQTMLPAPAVWQASTEYEIGSQVTDGTYLQEVTAIDETKTGEDGSASSGTATPTWATGLNATTTDGPLTWTNKGAAPAGDFLQTLDEPPRLTPLFGQIWPLSLHIPNAVQVYYVAGYGIDGEAVPALAKIGIMETVGTWYETREASGLEDVPDPVYRMLFPLIVRDLAPTR